MQYLVQMFTNFQSLGHIFTFIFIIKKHVWGNANWTKASVEIKDAFSYSIKALFFKILRWNQFFRFFNYTWVICILK